MPVEAEFERRRPPGPDPVWFEAHLLLSISSLGSIVIWSGIQQTHAEQVCVVWPNDANPVAMIESEIPVPERRWEFRTSGLWVEQVCETPNEHWSYGLEAFALELDDPTELVRTGYGTRVPMGWEFDFYATAPARWLLSDAAPLDRAGAYTQTGTLSGDYLDASGAHQTEGAAQRWHWWGTRPISDAGIRVEGPEQPIQRLMLPLATGQVELQRSPGSLALRSLNSLSA